MFSLRQFHRKENIYYTNNEPLKKNGILNQDPSNALTSKSLIISDFPKQGCTSKCTPLCITG